MAKLLREKQDLDIEKAKQKPTTAAAAVSLHSKKTKKKKCCWRVKEFMNIKVWYSWMNVRLATLSRYVIQLEKLWHSHMIYLKEL